MFHVMLLVLLLPNLASIIWCCSNIC